MGWFPVVNRDNRGHTLLMVRKVPALIFGKQAGRAETTSYLKQWVRGPLLSTLMAMAG